MRHRFRTKTMKSAGGKFMSAVFRCKRCGIVVEAGNVRSGPTGPMVQESPYTICDKKGIPRDCDEAVARRVMDS